MNLRGTQTLLAKEVRRFMRVPGQTVLSPLVTSGLYFLVFGFSLGSRLSPTGTNSYLEFIVPGLVFLGLANNAFLNSSSSLFVSKMQGTIVDLLVAPLGPEDLILGFVGGGMVRGLLVGLLTDLVATVFTGVHLRHPLELLVVVLLIAYVFALLGMIAAQLSDKFEQINFFPAFVMTPLTFLGGIFYSIRELPHPWSDLSAFNPLVYMVDLMRHAMLGHSDFSPAFGFGLLTILALVATLAEVGLLRRGYKLKT